MGKEKRSSSFSSSSSKRKVREEDIVEYLAKKVQKKAMKVAKKLKTQSVSGYANEPYPFGDSKLNETFVWAKKIERDVMHGVPLEEFSIKAEKKRQNERMAEIKKVKTRREERAMKKAQREEEIALLARERARAEFHDWEKKEEEFLFHQSKVRSEIRLREGHIKPIDVLSSHLNPSDDFVGMEIEEPYLVFKGLTAKEIEELHDDIKMHLDLDRATPTHIEYWEALSVVCVWELAESRKKDALDRANVRGEQPPEEFLAEGRGLHSSIEADVKNLLQGKTYVELEKLQSEIESQMRSGTAKVVEYWEGVIKRLHVYKAKACLKEIHTKMLRKHLQHLESLTTIKEKEFDHDDGTDDQPLSLEPLPTEEPIQDREKEEEHGSFSPELMHCDENEEIIDPEEDSALLERARMRVATTKTKGKMEECDVVFGDIDKYQPRKPKYVNHVHKKYEWNKYNHTHYDHDNPPPKIVHGYKFNIFYPDLLDKTKAPVYTTDKDGDSSETCIIRFHASLPYKDIAFRIVNKEWEYSQKNGFKCTFENGILRLYFNFKRHRYRR